MYLIVKLKQNYDPQSFINNIIETIKENNDFHVPTFKTWEIKTLSINNNKSFKLNGLKQTDTQLKDIGILSLHIQEGARDRIRINYANEQIQA